MLSFSVSCRRCYVVVVVVLTWCCQCGCCCSCCGGVVRVSSVLVVALGVGRGGGSVGVVGSDKVVAACLLHYLLYCLLRVACCLLLVACCIACCLLLVVLFVACCLLYCLLLVACCCLVVLLVSMVDGMKLMFERISCSVSAWPWYLRHDKYHCCC